VTKVPSPKFDAISDVLQIDGLLQIYARTFELTPPREAMQLRLMSDSDELSKLFKSLGTHTVLRIRSQYLYSLLDCLFVCLFASFVSFRFVVAVPSTISTDMFWMRFFFKFDRLIKQSQTANSSQDSDSNAEMESHVSSSIGSRNFENTAGTSVVAVDKDNELVRLLERNLQQFDHMGWDEEAEDQTPTNHPQSPPINHGPVPTNQTPDAATLSSTFAVVPSVDTFQPTPSIIASTVAKKSLEPSSVDPISHVSQQPFPKNSGSLIPNDSLQTSVPHWVGNTTPVVNENWISDLTPIPAESSIISPPTSVSSISSTFSAPLIISHTSAGTGVHVSGDSDSPSSVPMSPPDGPVERSPVDGFIAASVTATATATGPSKASNDATVTKKKANENADDEWANWE
jgi:hypothetical protein